MEDATSWAAAPFLDTADDGAWPRSWRVIRAWPVSHACVEHVDIAQLCRELHGRSDWEGFNEATIWLAVAAHWELVHQVSSWPMPAEGVFQHYGQDNGFGEEEGPVGVTISVKPISPSDGSRGLWNDEQPKQRLKDFEGELLLAGLDECQKRGGAGSFRYVVKSGELVEEGLRRNFGEGFLAHWRCAMLVPALQAMGQSTRSPRF